MIPLTEHLLDEGQLGDQELVWLSVQAIQVDLLTKLVPIDISTLVLIQVVCELSCLFFWEVDAEYSTDTQQDFISIQRSIAILVKLIVDPFRIFTHLRYLVGDFEDGVAELHLG